MIGPTVFLVCDESGHCRGVLNPLLNTCVPDEQIAEVEKAIPHGWHVERRTVRSASFFIEWLLEKGLAVHGQRVKP